MATISFVLKEPKSKVKTPIFMLFRFAGKRVKISTKELIETEFWNKKRQEVHSVFNYQQINNNLTKIFDNATKIYLDFLEEFKREPEPKELKILFDDKLFDDNITSTKKNQQKTFFEFFEDLIKVRDENKKVCKGRIHIYNNTLRLLKEFQNETKNLVAFERFDEQFSIKFREYLEVKKNYSANTIQKNFKVIRAVLNNAYIKNYNINREYKLPDFMPEGEDNFEIALTLEEVEKLYKHDFSKNKRLERIRDIFVLSCFTGLRYSDVKKLGKEHLQGKFLSVIQEKTKKNNPLPVIIPVLEPVREIFEKYNYILPNEISNQKTNLALKDMAKESGLFDDIITYHKIKGGKRVEISHPRYSEITFHTGRRTYCSMSYKLGVPTHSIMKISGHRTEKAFLSYLRISSTDHAERTLKIWEAYYSNNKKETGKTIEILQTA